MTDVSRESAALLLLREIIGLEFYSDSAAHKIFFIGFLSQFSGQLNDFGFELVIPSYESEALHDAKRLFILSVEGVVFDLGHTHGGFRYVLKKVI